MAKGNVTATIAIVSEDRILASLAELGQQMSDLDRRLVRIERRQQAAARLEQHISQEQTTLEAAVSDLSSVVTDLETRVSEMTSVEEGASTLLAELGQQVATLTTELQNAGVDPALVSRLEALGTVISDEDGKLAAAVAANTPAAPPSA